jgi:hypothetical protein
VATRIDRRELAFKHYTSQVEDVYRKGVMRRAAELRSLYDQVQPPTGCSLSERHELIEFGCPPVPLPGLLGTGVWAADLFALDGNHTLGREESRVGAFWNARTTASCTSSATISSYC